MSTVPAEIAGIGSTQQRLRVSPGFDPLKAAVGPEEYFVLSRIDGTQTLREVLLATGLPVERAIAIVTRLRSIGALLLPGETAAPSPTTMPARMTPAPAAGRRATSSGGAGLAKGTQETIISRHDLTLPDITADELAALAEDCDLDDATRRRVLAIARLVAGQDPFAVLGVPQDTGPRELKRAYFQLSKEIHPDRYYNKRLGSFTERMSGVFEAASRAYAQLADGKGRTAKRAARDSQPQTPQAYAAELFERACQLEVSGEPLEAMKLFAAAVRVDPQQPRYLRRAASCALAAGQPRSAVEYAKKAHGLAPTDPSAARLLATAFRVAGKLADAEEVLVMAMALKSENDVLGAELRNDLAEVRRLLGQPG